MSPRRDGPSPGPCPRPRHGNLRCRSRRCPSCGVLWAGDQRKKLLANVTSYGEDVALVTITGPGRAVLPHDDDGLVLEHAAWRWNRDAPGQWRKLHRAASQIARRRHGRFALVGETWEYQRRGLLHRHVILGCGTPAERAAADTYANALHELRERHGFGFVDRGRKHGGKRTLERIPAGRAARYVAKYLSPLDAAGKPTLSATVTKPDVPPHVVYVSVKLTQRTGVTMRSLREIRRRFVLERLGLVEVLDAGTANPPVPTDGEVTAVRPARGP